VGGALLNFRGAQESAQIITLLGCSLVPPNGLEIRSQARRFSSVPCEEPALYCSRQPEPGARVASWRGRGMIDKVTKTPSRGRAESMKIHARQDRPISCCASYTCLRRGRFWAAWLSSDVFPSETPGPAHGVRAIGIDRCPAVARSKRARGCAANRSGDDGALVQGRTSATFLAKPASMSWSTACPAFTRWFKGESDPWGLRFTGSPRHKHS
jgi:hypothetical protein